MSDESNSQAVAELTACSLLREIADRVRRTRQGEAGLYDDLPAHQPFQDYGTLTAHWLRDNPSDPDMVAAAAVEYLSRLSDEQRMETFDSFCTSCGCIQPDDKRCQCWNDE